MLKTYAFLLLLLPLALAAGCQSSNQADCSAAGCLWTNSTCVATAGSCLSEEFWSNSTQACVACSSLPSSTCSSSCSSYYYSSANSICQSCTLLDPSCAACSDSACTACVSGFQPDSNAPTACLPQPCLISMCQQCASPTTCYSCKAGFIVGSNGSYCAPAACSIANCLECLSSTTCAVCRYGYAMSGDRTTCTLVCWDPHCSVCETADTCQTCEPGYNYNSTTATCKVTCLVSNCAECELSTTCVSCSANYQLSPSLTSCEPVCSDPNCALCSTPATCSSCSTGFTLSNATCIETICYITDCAVCATSTTCSACNALTTLSPTAQLCTPDCAASVPNCAGCLTATSCGRCVAGYKLASPTLCSLVCSVTNCAVCRNDKLCLYCADTFALSSDGLFCRPNCGITNCLTCATATTCQTCQPGTTLSSSTTACNLACSPGFYASVTNATNCQLCSLAIPNCGTCLSAANATVVCTACTELYSLGGAGNCLLCSASITNCLTCSSPSVCTQCLPTFTLTVSAGVTACVTAGSCLVANCKVCVSGNSAKCLYCHDQYILSADGSVCTAIPCLSSQFYDADAKACICPVGTFLSGKVCAYCSIANCLSCNTGGCNRCKSKHFANSGICRKCPSNCITCTSGSYCQVCDYGYSLVNGVCEDSDCEGQTPVGNSTQPAVCPPGCAECGFTGSSIYCTVPTDGYSFDESGNIVRCSNNCLSCARSDPAICTSCPGMSLLQAGKCLGCSDVNALTCPGNIQYATSCVVGYSPFSGSCLQCADNCRVCGKEGAGLCDLDSCRDDYVRLVGTKNCTRCFSGCLKCDPADPSKCLSCGGTDFLSNSSKCEPCHASCLTCSSSTVCTSCPTSSILSGSLCYPRIGFPCAVQAQAACTTCFIGYVLTNGNCAVDTSCNATSSCLSCPKGYYLQSRKCFTCLTSATCDYCDPKKPANCLTCAVGYYLEGKTCVLCSTAIRGCKECTRASKCSKAQDGFYLSLKADGTYSGGVTQCHSRCATCSRAGSCETCASGRVRFGSACMYQKHLIGTITLASAKGSDPWFKDANAKNVNLALGLAHTNQVTSSLIKTAGYTDRLNLLLTRMISGSLIVDYVLDVDAAQDPVTFSQNFEANALGGVPDFKVLSISNSYAGFSSSNADGGSPNLGLILGTTIPLLFLLILIIIFIKVYRSDELNEKETEDTNKEVQLEF